MENPGDSKVNIREAVAAARANGTDQDASTLIQWAYDLLGGGLMMSTAFGKSGMCIMFIIKELGLDLPIYFVDTGFHFRASLDFADRLRDEWGLHLRLKRPQLYGDAFKQKHGEKLYETDPDLCCQKNKVEPFAELLQDHRGWITGVRRDQSSSRKAAEPIEVLEGDKLKVQPLAFWTRVQVDTFIAQNKVPLHPLFASGYTSIGCEPCTRPNSDVNDERAGRWAGKAKTECGLHTYWKKKETKSESPPADEANSQGKQQAG